MWFHFLSSFLKKIIISHLLIVLVQWFTYLPTKSKSSPVELQEETKLFGVVSDIWCNNLPNQPCGATHCGSLLNKEATILIIDLGFFAVLLILSCLVYFSLNFLFFACFSQRFGSSDFKKLLLHV